MSRNPRRVPARIQDMLEATRNARSDMGDLSKEEFLVDGKTQRAVIASIVVIGEAANHIMRLDPSIEQTNPSLWQQLRDSYDMRIVLTHEYFRVDAAIVWTTVKNHLPQLESLLITFSDQDDRCGNESRGSSAGGAA